MTTTTASNVPSIATSNKPVVWRAGLAAGVVAGLATSAIAAVASAADVPIEVGGKAIPILGFANLTVVFAMVGVAIAAVLARRVAHARRAFVITTLGLTAASFVPDLTADGTTATKLVLMATHAVAAAIIIPAIAARLND